jgi:hypothetical protein
LEHKTESLIWPFESVWALLATNSVAILLLYIVFLCIQAIPLMRYTALELFILSAFILILLLIFLGVFHTNWISHSMRLTKPSSS